MPSATIMQNGKAILLSVNTLTAHECLASAMSDILVFNPLPDKSADSLAWAAHMTEVKRIAEKMMLDKIVYA